MNRWATLALILFLGGLAGLWGWQVLGVSPTENGIILVLPPPVLPTSTPDPAKEQYYRGIYDVCVYFGAREHPTERGKKLIRVACRELLKRVIKNGWYEDDTLDWDWPIKDKKQKG